ncbi:MAG: outer membrane lipoprotein chaperone LolA [Candidatus Polarisedimenticolaceae bacterium]|nr:outer membrane lipoprotein chaperone LolA [Candidatus Polarisedimenticolaceae bacterium]
MKKLWPLFLLLLPFAASAASGTEQLQRFLANLTTLQAEFEQMVITSDNDSYTSSGTLYLNRPGKFRWEYRQPIEQLIVADGDRVWLHDMELEQVSHRSQSAMLEGTPAQIFSEIGPLERHFTLTDSDERDGLIWVVLAPKNSESQFATISVALTAESELKRMEFIDQFGQVTLFMFSDLVRNPILDEKLFIFIPPPLIDILGD